MIKRFFHVYNVLHNCHPQNCSLYAMNLSHWLSQEADEIEKWTDSVPKTFFYDRILKLAKIWRIVIKNEGKRLNNGILIAL